MRSFIRSIHDIRDLGFPLISMWRIHICDTFHGYRACYRLFCSIHCIISMRMYLSWNYDMELMQFFFSVIHCTVFILLVIWPIWPFEERLAILFMGNWAHIRCDNFSKIKNSQVFVHEINNTNRNKNKIQIVRHSAHSHTSTRSLSPSDDIFFFTNNLHNDTES